MAALVGVIGFVYVSPETGRGTAALEPPTPWAAPSVKTLKRLEGPAPIVTTTSLYHNIGCEPLTVRAIRGTADQEACVVPTAFGQYDLYNRLVTFNGNDRAIPLKANSPSDLLLPWPNTQNVLALLSASGGGTSLRMYRNIVPILKDERNALGQLVAKQVDGPTDIGISDATGAPLIINPSTLAFSANSAWAVVEQRGGSFMRINLATLEARPFAASYWTVGNAITGNTKIAISDNGRYVVLVSNVGQTFRIYDLQDCSTTNGSAGRCRHYDYWPFLSDGISTSMRVSSVNFINDGLLSFIADGVQYLVAPAAGIDFHGEYLAMGDSYASGEGAYSYVNGTDTVDDRCHSSYYAWPARLGRDVFSGSGAHSVACSGAVIRDIADTSPGYVGQMSDGKSWQALNDEQPSFIASVRANFIPGHLAQAHFLPHTQPRHLTVMVGGNDAGFGQILERCVMPRLGQGSGGNTCYATYEDRQELQQMIDRLVPRWSALFKQLQSAAPQTTVWAVGYPQIVDDTGNCAVNVRLSQVELAFSRELIDYINSALYRATVQARVRYVDISTALDGFRLCETSSHLVAVNGLTAGDDAGAFGFDFLGKESYHPNAQGHYLIEQAILRKTRNFAAQPVTIIPTEPAKEALAKGPKTNRPVRKVKHTKVTKTTKVKKGKAVRVSTKGKRLGLKPRSSFSIRLRSPSGPVLATPISDAEGDITTDVIIPPDTPGGGTAIHIIGPDQAEQETDNSQNIHIDHDDDDSDGDGTPDTTDSCPLISNAGIDIDADQIDDACDGIIGLPSSPQPESPQLPSGPLPPIDSGLGVSPPSASAPENIKPVQGSDAPTVNVQPAASSMSGTRIVAAVTPTTLALTTSGPKKQTLTHPLGSRPSDTGKPISVRPHVPPPSLVAHSKPALVRLPLPVIHWWLLVGFMACLYCAHFILSRLDRRRPQMT